ncbi:hypothetical protein GCM10020331_099910 [Ectobacillus funiculus]
MPILWRKEIRILRLNIASTYCQVFKRVNQDEIYWQVENERGQIIAGSHNLYGQHIKDSKKTTLKRMDENTFSWDPVLNGVPLRAMSMQLKSQK